MKKIWKMSTVNSLLTTAYQTRSHLQNLLLSILVIFLFSIPTFSQTDNSAVLIHEPTPADNQSELEAMGIYDDLNNDNATPFDTFNLEDYNDKINMRIQDYFKVVVVINRDVKGATKQSAKVYVNGKFKYKFKVSTGKVSSDGGIETPKGYFLPYFLNKDHYSRKYDAPMPNSVFFVGGVAMHQTLGSANLAKLGKEKASHGCVRMTGKDSQIIFDLIRATHYDSNGHRIKNYVPYINKRNGEVASFDLNDRSTLREVDYNALVIVEDRNEAVDIDLPPTNILISMLSR